jgi:hypothetical protein
LHLTYIGRNNLPIGTQPKGTSVAQAYEVVDVQNQRAVFECDNAAAAYREADRRDAEYGAVRYQVRRDYEVMSADEFEQFMSRVRSERVQ